MAAVPESIASAVDVLTGIIVADNDPVEMERSIRWFFGLNPLPSETTSHFLELLATEASLLHHQIQSEPSVDPGHIRLVARYNVALALMQDLVLHGSIASGFEPRGLGTRTAAAQIVNNNVQNSVRVLADIRDQAGDDDGSDTVVVKRPAGLPSVVGLGNVAAMVRPSHLFQVDVSTGAAAGASAVPVSSCEGSVHSLWSRITGKLSKGASVGNSASDVGYTGAGLNLKARPNPALTTPLKLSGAALELAVQKSSSSEAGSTKFNPALKARVAEAKAKLERLDAAEQLRMLESEFAAQCAAQDMQSSSGSASEKLRDAADSPRVLARSVEVGSPSPDEEAARCLRSQLEEVERRIAVEKVCSADPVSNFKDRLNQLALENAMLKKTLGNSPDHWFENKNLSKEADRIAISSTPTADNYKSFRASIGVAMVAASGPNRPEVPGFFDFIETDVTPEELASSCPPHLLVLDSKLASALANIVKGAPGDRINLAIDKYGSKIRYSGRAILKLIDDEFAYLSKESRASLVAQLYKLKPSGNNSESLETFLQTLEKILLQLKGSKEQPSDLFIRTLLEDKVEVSFAMKFVAAEFAARRVNDDDCVDGLIEALKEGCRRERLRSGRIQLAAPVGYVDSSAKAAPKVKASPASGSEKSPVPAAPATESKKYCFKFQLGKCSAGKTCQYAHEKDSSYKPKFPTPGAKAATPAVPATGKRECHFYKKGKCTAGKNCKFLHSDSTPQRSGAALIISGVVRVLPVVGQLQVPVESAALDSGSGAHIVGQSSLPSGSQPFEVDRVRLHSANGILNSDRAVDLPIPIPDDPTTLRCRILPNSPNVVSLGRLCAQHKYGILWFWDEEPLLFTPDKRCFKIPLQHFVPIISQDLQQLPQVDIKRLVDKFITGVVGDEGLMLCSLAMPSSGQCLIEYCCSDNSILGVVAEERGIFLQRFGLSFGDLSVDQIIDKAVGIAESAPPGTKAWLSLPCAPWSPLQNLNLAVAAGKGKAELKAMKFRLKRDQEKSRKLLAGFDRVAEVLHKKGGELAKEWPTPSKGWKDETVIAFENKYGMQRRFIDGCTQGLKCPTTNLPLLKPYCISTNSRSLIEKLDSTAVRCNGSHLVHGESMGGNASLTELYTRDFATLVLDGLFPTTRALPVVEDLFGGLPPPIAETAAEETSLTKSERLQLEALSSKHQFTHLPANPYCKHCVIGKQRRAQHRRISTGDEFSGDYGDQVYADHIISRNCVGIGGETCAAVFLDRASRCSYPYPADSNTAVESERALRHFLGSKLFSSCTLFSDNSGELSAASKSLGINHQLCTPNVPQSHGIQEIEEQALIQGARTCLHQSQLPLTYWPYAIRHFAVARMIDKDLIQPLQTGRAAHNFLRVPFGAVVSVKPPVGHEGAKFAPSGEEHLFLGWNILPGLQFRGEYIVVPLSDFVEGRAPSVKKSVNVRLLPPPFQFAVNDLMLAARQKRFEQLGLGSSGVDAPVSIEFEGEDEVVDDTGQPSLLPVPLPASGSAELALPKGPTGRPQTRMPPSFNGRYAEWSRLSKKRQQQEIDLFKEQCESKAKGDKVTALVSALVDLVCPSAAAGTLSAVVSQHQHFADDQIPSNPDPISFGSVPVQPSSTLSEVNAELSQEHRPRNPEDESAGNYFEMFSLIIKTVTKSEPAWNSAFGQKALFDELFALKEALVFSAEVIEYTEAVKQQPDGHFVHLFPILGIKNFELGPSFHKFKARFVLQGSRILDILGQLAQFEQVSNCPTSMSVIRQLAVYSSVAGEDCLQADAVAAYIQHELRPEDGPATYVVFDSRDLLPIVLQVFPKLVGHRRPCLRLLKPLYGHPKAGLLWERFLDRTLGGLRWIAAKPFPQLFVKTVEGELCRKVLAAYVDDIHTGGKGQKAEWELIRKVIKTTDPVVLSRSLGVNYELSRPKPGIVTMRQEMTGYSNGIVDKTRTVYSNTVHGRQNSGRIPLVDTPAVELTSEMLEAPGMSDQGAFASECASIVMSLMYLARMCRLDLLFAVNRMSQFLSKWTKLADAMLLRCIGYLAKYPDLTLEYTLPSGEEFLKAIFCNDFADADYAGCAFSARSTTGAIHGMSFEGFPQFRCAVVDWFCKRQSSVAHSTTDAEVTAADKTVRDLTLPAQLLWEHFLGRPVASRLNEDNQSTIRVIQNGYSATLRYLPKTQRVSLSGLQEHFNKTGNELRYIASAEQLADLLTKPLERLKLQAALELVGLRRIQTSS